MQMLGIMLLGAGDTIYVGETLKGMGVPGAIIIVLMGVITLLAGVIVVQWRQANKVYGFRLAERDVLNSALNDSKTALGAMLDATKERNEITDDLAEVITRQAAAFDQVSDRIRMHYEGLRDDNARLHMVVNAIAESMRVLTGIATDGGRAASALTPQIADVIKKIDELKTIMNRPSRARPQR